MLREPPDKTHRGSFNILTTNTVIQLLTLTSGLIKYFFPIISKTYYLKVQGGKVFLRKIHIKLSFFNETFMFKVLNLKNNSSALLCLLYIHFTFIKCDFPG